MAGHTKGPWKACDVGDYGDYDGNCRVIVGDDMRIAVVFAGGNEPMQAENKANAELIAAAPETAAERDRLLAENERLREVLEKIADNTHDEESREIARAALAKAEAAQ